MRIALNVYADDSGNNHHRTFRRDKRRPVVENIGLDRTLVFAPTRAVVTGAVMRNTRRTSRAIDVYEYNDFLPTTALNLIERPNWVSYYPFSGSSADSRTTRATLPHYPVCIYETMSFVGTFELYQIYIYIRPIMSAAIVTGNFFFLKPIQSNSRYCFCESRAHTTGQNRWNTKIKLVFNTVRFSAASNRFIPVRTVLPCVRPSVKSSLFCVRQKSVTSRTSTADRANTNGSLPEHVENMT